MSKERSRKKSKRKGSGLFFLVVVVLALLAIFIVFLINKNQIVSNYKDTGFFDKLFGVTPEFVENHEPEKIAESTDEKMSEEEIIISLKADNSVKDIEDYTAPAESNTSKPVETPAPSSNKVENQSKQTEKPKVEEKVETAPKKAPEQPKKAPTSDLQLCFVYISPEGSVMRQMVKRTVPKTDSPLTTAINLILRGPDVTASAEKNLTSLIPAGTKLLGAKVQDGVAYLNFSNEFAQNSYGVDGYNAQLMQVVYTASAFSTVNSVQFLVEGEKLPYLSEGIWIGSPLSKNSF